MFSDVNIIGNPVANVWQKYLKSMNEKQDFLNITNCESTF